MVFVCSANNAATKVDLNIAHIIKRRDCKFKTPTLYFWIKWFLYSTSKLHITSLTYYYYVLANLIKQITFKFPLFYQHCYVTKVSVLLTIPLTKKKQFKIVL